VKGTRYGFTMGDNSARNGVRSTIIADLARAIIEVAKRGLGIDIAAEWILDELEHFVNDPDTGRAEASEGWHDDWVLALCIAYAIQASATMYVAPVDTLHFGEDDEHRTGSGTGGHQV
jgi:hypothetical protein